MKKLILLFILALAGIFYTFAQDNEKPYKDDNGVSVKISGSIPYNNYGNLVYTESSFGKTTLEVNHERGYKFAVGMSVENSWYLWGRENKRLGIDARWIAMDYSQIKNQKVPDEPYMTRDYRLYYLNVASPGIIFTIDLNEKHSLDFQYNLAPTFAIDRTIEYLSTDIGYSGYKGLYTGIDHMIGATFRINWLLVGVEQQFGRPRDSDVAYDWHTGDEYLEKEIVKGTKTRVFVGVKF